MVHAKSDGSADTYFYRTSPYTGRPEKQYTITGRSINISPDDLPMLEKGLAAKKVFINGKPYPGKLLLFMPVINPAGKPRLRKGFRVTEFSLENGERYTGPSEKRSA